MRTKSAKKKIRFKHRATRSFWQRSSVNFIVKLERYRASKVRIRALSNLRMLEQLLRASFAASSASSHLPLDCTRSMRRDTSQPRRSGICAAGSRVREVAAGVGHGEPDVGARDVAARVPSPASSVCVCLGSRHLHFHVLQVLRLASPLRVRD